MRMLILVACLWLATNALDAKIVFRSSRAGEGAEIYTMNSDGSNQTRITDHPRGAGSPAWSPNGRQIVFTGYTLNDPDSSIWTMDADGTNRRQLIFPPEFAGYPDWSPDGTRIVFDSIREPQEGKPPKLEIYVMNADGSNVMPVTDVGFASRPRWSPDGQWILFEGIALDEIRHIYAIQPDGTNMWRISEPLPERAMYLGGWSPDGKQAVYAAHFHAKVTDTTMIVASLHLGNQPKVKKREAFRLPHIPDMTGSQLVSFGADGKSLLFSGRIVKNWEIFRFRLDTREVIQLTDAPGSDKQAREYNPRLSVSPKELIPTRWGEIKSNQLQQ